MKILRCCNWRSSTKRLETSTSKSATKKMKIRCHENQFRRFRRTMKRPSPVNCRCWMKSSTKMRRGEVWWNCIVDDATIHKDATTGTTPMKTTDAAKSTMKSTETATVVKSNRRNNSTDGDGSTNADGDASGVAGASKKIAVPTEL